MNNHSHTRTKSARRYVRSRTITIAGLIILIASLAFALPRPHLLSDAAPLPLMISDPAPQPLPYLQDFSSLAHSSNVYPPGWQGWQVGSGTSAGSSATFKTIDGTSDLVLTANSSASSTAGAIHNFNGKLGSLSTGSADPSMGLAIDTTAYTGVNVTFDAMTIRNPYNGTTNTRISEVDLQYRVCSSLPCSGTYASASASPGIYQNNTTLQTSGTTPQKSETKSITLPAAANNQSNVQLRWVQRDVSGGGARPSFAVDNISVTGAALCSSPVITVEPGDQAVTYGASVVSFTSAASGDPTPTVHWEVDSGGGFVPVSNGGDISGADTPTLTISNPTVAISGGMYRAVFSNECGGTQTATSVAANLSVDPLEVTITPDSGAMKLYGDADPALTFAYSPALIGTDSFTGDLSRAAGEIVGIYEISLGTLAVNSNYQLSVTPGVTFEIAPKTLVASIVADDKIYDGTTAAMFSCSLTGVVGSDDVACIGGIATFDDRHRGTHFVTATGLAFAGDDALNYTLPVTVATDDAEIFARPITVSAVADSKTYDGSNASSGIPVVTTGSIVSGDIGAFSQSFDSKHAGTGKTIVPSGSVSDGNGGNNYAITFASVATGEVTQKPVTVTAMASAKAFDGNTSSPGVPIVTPDLVAGDAPAFLQTYDTPAAGTGKTLTPSGIASDGNGGANYAYTFVAVNTGIITASYCFDGFLSPMGGSVERGDGGSFADPVRAFKLNSTIPIKFTLYAGSCSGSPVVIGVHTLQMIKYANAVDSEPAIDATPTDAATTGNQFRLSDTTWVYNLDTKRTPGISTGTWLVKATLFDGSVKTVWISIKK